MDSHEPGMMEMMLRPSLPNFGVMPLNISGWADYMWLDVQGDVRQWERKTVAEIFGDMDGVEEQLNRELNSCKELTLVVEGVWEPTVRGVVCYKRDVNKAGIITYTPGFEFSKQSGLAKKYASWKWTLDRVCGVNVVETHSTMHTAMMLTAAYSQSQKEEYTTLRRYLKPHIPSFSPNPHVDNLARLKGAGIGPANAQKLVDAFATFEETILAGFGAWVRVLGGAGARKFRDCIRGVEEE